MVRPLAPDAVKQAVNPSTMPKAPRGLQALLLKERAAVGRALAGEPEHTEALAMKLAKTLAQKNGKRATPAAFERALTAVRVALKRLAPGASVERNFAVGAQLAAEAAQQPKRIHLRDYQPPTFDIPEIDLRFDVRDDATTVTQTSRLVRRGAPGEPLVFLGHESMELVSIRINGTEAPASAYTRDAHGLTIHAVPDAFELQIVTRVKPQDNASAMGLYKAGSALISHCEPDGFRRMSFTPDRPDVLSVYTTTVEADAELFPTLLSNGNEVRRAQLPGGRQSVTFLDPDLKGTHIFAVVAGRFDRVTDTYKTRSGRSIALEFYADPGDGEKTRWAMQCLKDAMASDEAEFGYECNLERYAVVVTNVFNMGAMENKGLNVFNASRALADPRTATDDDFAAIAQVVPHEFFHDLRGNRIGMRDPLQLTVKEGLTVFRDQLFTEEQGGGALRRIDNVSNLRSVQFAEDAGPQAHAIRPDSYIAPNNLYTATVYRKGAEVARMLHTLLGAEGFRIGMAEYLRRHDGQAVTTEQFIAAMAEPNGFDATQFLRWYDQKGTPTVRAEGRYDAATKTYSLTLEQQPGRPGAAPLHMPVRMGLVGAKGDLPLALRGAANTGAAPTEMVLELKEERQTFVFENVAEAPLPSLLRNFSAPVKLDVARSTADLEALLARDSDSFNRYDAGQRLASDLLLDMVRSGDGVEARLARYVEVMRDIAADPRIEPGYKARLLGIPDAMTLAQAMPEWDFAAIESARDQMRVALGTGLRDELQALYDDAVAAEKPYAYDQEQVGQRAIKNTALGLLLAAGAKGAVAAAEKQLARADNLTDRMGALSGLVSYAFDHKTTRNAVVRFFKEYAEEPLVLDKWFAAQASSAAPGALGRVRALLEHPKFDIKVPNRARAVLGSFIANHRHFQAADGSGYELIADQVIALAALNPQTAAGFAKSLSHWRRFEPKRRELARAALARIVAVPKLGGDVFEVVSNALKD